MFFLHSGCVRVDYYGVRRPPAFTFVFVVIVVFLGKGPIDPVTG
jgi:hypothetical protein